MRRFLLLLLIGVATPRVVYADDVSAVKLLVGRSNITMLLPQLERRALVRRESDEKDRRVLRLYLTESGEALLMEALTVHMALIEKVMATASAADCDFVGDHMRRISEALKVE